MINILRKTDEEQQIVWGEVYAPTIPDSQGDFMLAEDIQLMAYDFVKKGKLGQIDIQHDNQVFGAHIVETFIARDDDPIFIPKSWVIGVHIPNTDVWGLIKDGTLNGFSLEALAVRTEKTINLDIPEQLTGQTDEMSGHTHAFTVKFAPDGTFLGGWTDEAEDGHSHLIKKGTATEEVDNHSHRFSFVEELSISVED